MCWISLAHSRASKTVGASNSDYSSGLATQELHRIQSIPIDLLYIAHEDQEHAMYIETFFLRSQVMKTSTCWAGQAAHHNLALDPNWQAAWDTRAQKNIKSMVTLFFLDEAIMVRLNIVGSWTILLDKDMVFWFLWEKIVLWLLEMCRVDQELTKFGHIAI